jgi:hypothetical protein
MKELRRSVNEKYKYTLAFIGFDDEKQSTGYIVIYF